MAQSSTGKFSTFWRRLVHTAARLERGINALEGRKKLVFLSLCFVVITGFFLFGAVNHLYEVNVNERRKGLLKNDQEDYMLFAKRLVATDYAYVGDGNRVQLYPLIQTVHYRPTVGMEAYFIDGKYLNIALAVVLLAGFFGIYLRFLPTLAALNLMLLTTFQLFVFRAAYFQAELLYYTLSFAAFVLMLVMLNRPSWVTAAALGVMAATAQLAKASFLPALGLFILVYITKQSLMVWNNRHSPAAWGRFVGAIGQGAAALALFFAVLYPSLDQMKRAFGSHFYNVNSTFYIWYQDKAEVEGANSTKAHGDSIGYPVLPEDQIPSWHSYLAETSPARFIDRMRWGGALAFQRHLIPGSYGYSPYIFAYLGLLLAMLGAPSIHQSLRERLKKHAAVVFFTAAFMLGYITLYVFYMRISGGQRFHLALLMPLLFSLALAVNSPLFQHLRVKIAGEDMTWAAAFHISLLPVLILHGLYNALYFAAFIFYAGD